MKFCQGFALTDKELHFRFVTRTVWAEVAVWLSQKSAIRRKGWSRRQGGVEYVGKKYSIAAQFIRGAS